MLIQGIYASVATVTCLSHVTGARVGRIMPSARPTFNLANNRVAVSVHGLLVRHWSSI